MGVKIELLCLVVLVVMDVVLNCLALLRFQISGSSFVVKGTVFYVLEYSYENCVDIEVPIMQSIAVEVLGKRGREFYKGVPI